MGTRNLKKYINGKILGTREYQWEIYLFWMGWFLEHVNSCEKYMKASIHMSEAVCHVLNLGLDSEDVIKTGLSGEFEI